MTARPTSFSCDGVGPPLLAPHISARLSCPPVRSPRTPSSQPPLGLLPSVPKCSLPAPTVSATRFPPPPRPPLYCSLSLRLRDARHDVEPERRFSARWCPVELLFHGSKKGRAGGAALSGGACWGAAARIVVAVTCDEASGLCDRRRASCISCDGCGGRIGPGARRGTSGGFPASPASRACQPRALHAQM
jgi:hypothetical protein